jgi:uncharacterized protein (DUF362 family)
MSFYNCSKCQRTWQYELKTCPYCFSELNKVESKKAKVFAISKVMIPTLTHPNVPYFALILEDENGHKWTHKSIKEYKVGEELEFDKNENGVAIWRIKYDISEAILKVLELLDCKPKEDLKVLILPTLTSPNHAYLRENTSPQFLEGVFEYLSNNNIKNIKVAAQSFDEMPVGVSAQKSGLLDVCLKRNITPFDLAKTNFISKDDLEISEEILNADLVLNLGALKMGKAEASLNSFKILKKDNYSKLKYLSSEKEIAEKLNNVLSNIITLGDAESVQRSNKVNTYLGLILASKNTLKLDRIFNEIVKANKMPEITKDLENIETVGRDINEVNYNAEVF